MTDIKMIFDTNCILCSGFVQFILKHERDHNIIFVNAWSQTGLQLAASHGLSREDLQKTYLVIVDGVAHMRSNAGLKILSHLNVPWRWLRLFVIVPRPLRDLVYSTVAKRRYQWFGFQENCFIVTPEMRHRFIEK